MSIASVVHVLPAFFTSARIAVALFEPYTSDVHFTNARIGCTYKAIVRFGMRNMSSVHPGTFADTNLRTTLDTGSIKGLTCTCRRWGTAAVKEFPDAQEIAVVQVFEVECVWRCTEATPPTTVEVFVSALRTPFFGPIRIHANTEAEPETSPG
jgi:hypothetical protein